MAGELMPEWDLPPEPMRESGDAVRLASALLLAVSGDRPLTEPAIILEHASRDDLTGAATYLARWIIGCAVVPVAQFRAELAGMLATFPPGPS
jgi:hypothetical protein